MTEYLDLVMFAALMAAILMGFPVAFSIAGVAVLFAYLGWVLGVMDISLLGALGQRAFGLLSNQVLIAIPLLIQTYGIFVIAYWAARRLRLKHNVAGPACLIGTSNFFELAVAVAISLFGLHSGAALATVVGVLVEVPVMLTLVAIVNRTPHWFEENPA